jgi:hypothetical protein
MFDSTTQRPTATILPPSPPEGGGGGGPQRIRIEIEIVDRRAQPPRPRGYRFGTLTMVLIIMLLAALLVQAFEALDANRAPAV